MAIRTAKSTGGNWGAVGTWVEGVVPSTSDDVIFNASSGNVTLASTANFKTLDCTGYTGTITHNTGITWGCYGNLIKFSSNMTYNPSGTAVLRVAGNFNAQIYTFGKSLLNLSSASNASFTLTDTTNILGTLTIGTGVIATLNADITVGTLSFTTAAQNTRAFVRSNIVGTQRTITATTISTNGCDFMDIKGAGAANWDLSATAIGTGDCGGNSGITFTTGVNQTWKSSATGGALNWHDGANWDSGRPPLAHENATVAVSLQAGASFTVTTKLNLGKNIDLSSFAPYSSDQVTFLGENRIFGSLILPTGLLTNNSSSNAYFRFLGRNGTFSITSNSKTITSAIAVEMYNATLTLKDNLNVTSTGSIYCELIQGHFDATDGGTINPTIRLPSLKANSTQNKTITFGTGKWTVYSILSSSIILSSSNLTLNTSNSTISIEGYTQTINLDNATFNVIEISMSSNQVLTVSSGFTCNSFINTGPNNINYTITFTKNSTINLNGTSFLIGNSGKLLTINNLSLSKSSGIVACDYLILTNSDASGGATFYAGANSTDNGSNSGWIFTGPPRGNAILFGGGI